MESDDGAVIVVGDQPALPTSPPPSDSNKPARHRRGLPGNLFSRLNFSPTPSKDAKPIEPEPDTKADHGQEEDESLHDHDETLLDSSMPTSAMILSQAAKQRKRKGSLRKTALLGTGRLKAEGRERRNSLLHVQRTKNAEDHLPQHQHPITLQSHSLDHTVELLPIGQPPPSSHTTSHDQPTIPSPISVPHTDGDTQPKLSLDIVQRQNLSTAAEAQNTKTATPSSLLSPIISPTSQSYTSTTDDDEALTLPDATLSRPPLNGSDSYFPAQPSVQRRRSSKKPPSPLSAIPVNAYGTDEEYDYSETEWWGWVVLVVTWIVFVVGMGSCFSLWSWAWDVGETPYAPPELEDDPTLPIVGYYPALIILTGVMAWVWVVVAWVGMKYFKHAKMAGEDV